MSRIVFANEDLKRHIFSFGYPEHIAFTKSLTESLKVDCSPFQERYWAQDRHLSQYLEEFTEVELMNYMHYFNRCKCCTRHSHYKPYVGFDRIHVKIAPNAYRGACECPCRSLARHCARSVNRLKNLSEEDV